MRHEDIEVINEVDAVRYVIQACVWVGCRLTRDESHRASKRASNAADNHTTTGDVDTLAGRLVPLNQHHIEAARRRRAL
jgi:hypothetical protein